MQANLVSIVMPAYNGEAFIHQALQSIQEQSYPHWECIVIDDGSTDRTAEIVQGLHDERIYYYCQANQGQAAALNHGLRRARGEFVTTLDVDDWFTPNSLRDRVEYFTANPGIDVVYGDGFYCDAKGAPLRLFSDNRRGSFTGDVYSALVVSPFFGTGANVMVRRQILDQHDLWYDEAIVWCQDYDFYVRIAEHGRFGLVASPTVWYRLHNSNMTMSMASDRQLKSLLRMKHKIMMSARFRQLPAQQRAYFFGHLLMTDVKDRPAEQQAVVDSPYFQQLPPDRQARLVRLVAGEYLMDGVNNDFARFLLRRACSLAPFDPANLALAVAAHTSPSLARTLLGRWRRHKKVPAKPPSVLEAARNSL